jgi:hypothetical protein
MKLYYSEPLTSSTVVQTFTDYSYRVRRTYNLAEYKAKIEELKKTIFDLLAVQDYELQSILDFISQSYLD